MNYLYLISINLGWVTIYKIGVAQNVKARMAHMIRQTGCECKLIASWGFEGKYGDCLLDEGDVLFKFLLEAHFRAKKYLR